MISGAMSDTEVSSSSECASSHIFNKHTVTEEENAYAINITMTNTGNRNNGDNTFASFY